MISSIIRWPWLICLLLALFASTPLQAGSIVLAQSQAEIVVVPGFDHVPLKIPFTLAPCADVSGVHVVSDLAWAVPEVDTAGNVTIRFQTRDLLASATATVTVSHETDSVSLFLSAIVKPLDVYRLLDDPFRNLTYGIQIDGANAGAVFTYDPQLKAKGVSLTIGKRPTDFVVSDDGSELLVICSADKKICVVDLATFTLKETLALPLYESWGSATDTTANIDLGAGNIIYYTDGSWGPILRVYDRSTKQVIQSLRFDGGAPANDTGFQDFAVTRDRKKIIAMPQYGWSAGGHTPVIAHYSIAANGWLTFLSQSTVTTGLEREPFEAPALISENDQSVFLKTIAVSSQNINDIQKSYPSAVWSISPGGEWVATATDIYDYTTGNKLLTIPGATSDTNYSNYTATKAQAFTSDYTRFVYFNSTDRSLNSLDLVALTGPGPDGQSFTPAPGSVVTAPQKLKWTARLGISSYNLYLGASAETVSAATPTSPEFVANVSGTQYVSSSLPTAPGTYYWRLDPISAFGPQKGMVFSFTVSPISLDRTSIKVRNVTGSGSLHELLQLNSIPAGETWSVTSDRNWITFPESSGTAPKALAVVLNTANLTAGVHLGTITLTTSAGNITIPVELSLDALRLTVVKSDPLSSKLYAISENTDTPGSKAFLLEIDSATESILRVVEVGTSATDLSLHRSDDKIYVTNWQGGSLLAVDRSTFQITRTYPFTPFGGVGYGSNDAYKIAAGGPGRLVVEEADQWIDVSIYNTVTGTKMANVFLREGGGAFDSTGRYYYHGENNSSGASIYRYDVTGDAFTELAEVRPDGISAYGSRTVVVSENNQRVFWANSVMNAALALEWNIGEIVYSCSADGRFAFAENKIYDINRRLAVLGMPVATQVSAFNSTTSKLVTEVGGKLAFNSLSLPLNLPAPVLQTPEWAGNSLAVKWTENSLETGFHLQRRVTGTTAWTDVSAAIEQNITTHSVTGLNDATSYDFRIRAFAPEASSEWSNILVVDLAQFPSAAPVLTAASPGNPNRINLTWTLSGSNTQVVVERASASVDDWQTIATLPSGTLSFANTDLLPSTTHRYRVKSMKGSIASPYSNIRTATTPALTAPSTPSISTYTAQTASRVYLAWSSVSLATSYRLERKLSSGSTWSLLAEIPQDSLNYSDTTVAPATTYSYRLFAINSVGSSSASTTRNVTTPSVPAPTVPQNLAGQAHSSNQIALSWSDSSNETGYRIERNIGEGAWQVAGMVAANITSFLDAGLENGIYYNYRVIAFNSVGAEARSAEINVLAALTGALLADDFDPALDLGVWSSLSGGTAITGPQGFLAGKALWFGAGGSRSAATVPVDLSNGGTLVFQFRAGNQTTDGTTHWNNSEVNENVVLEYSTGGGTWELLAILSTEYPNHKTWTHYSITVPNAARTNATRFRWRQLSNSGVSQDTWALDDFEVRGVLPAPPLAPNFVIANANAARAVAITWSASAQSTHYTVQRRTPSTEWTPVGTTPSYENYFTDTSVAPATAYSYRVIAENTGGLSDPSNHAFVTTWSILQEWRFQNYGTLSASGNAGDLADNGTGVANLLKYAFNMSKDDRYLTLAPDGDKGLPFITVEGSGLQVAFLRRRDTAAAGIRYVVEFSSNLTVWDPAGTQVLAEPVDEDFEYVIWRDAPSAAATGRYARVRVEKID